MCVPDSTSQPSFINHSERRMAPVDTSDRQRLALCPARALLPYFGPVLARVEFLYAGQ